MRRFIHEAEDLVVFAPDLYKRPVATNIDRERVT